ncbi:MFS transporter [Streptomyces sp. NRRL WC-3742]|uniref:MFS transporter n=1 Tax=Streptomyces sp. NRRL WC-3742 TaxID=1463934 RepID=UPI0004CC10A0|nr:MFS transporter [Streptomyces sp. NRRL WC-3742]
MSSNPDINWTSHPRTTLAVVCLAGGLLPASLTGASVALPDIAGDLGAGLGPLQWVVNGYNLAFASFMLACGALADLVGRRRMLAFGMTLFGLCSLVSGLSGNIYLLDGARLLAGLAAAAVLTAGSAVLASTFSGPAQAKAFGVLGSSFGVGLALGPSTSGVLVSAVGWRSVFLVHAAIALALLPALPRLAESRDPGARGVDWGGTVTFTSALALVTLAMVEGPQQGWTSAATLGLLAGSALLLALFVVVELRQERPMFDLALFTRGRFTAICVVPVALAFGFVCLLVFLPSYLMGAGRFSSSAAGGVMLLLTAPVLVFPMVAGHLARTVPVRTLLAGSLLLVGGGAAWLTTVHPGIGVAGLVGPFLVIGTGVGISFGLLDGAAIGSVPPERAGMAAGMFNTMRLAGEAVAIAGMGSVLVSLVGSKVSDGLAAYGSTYTGDPDGLAAKVAQGNLAGPESGVAAAGREAFHTFLADGYTDALRTVLWVLAAVAALTAPLIALMLRDREPAATPTQMPAAEPASEPSPVTAGR